MRTYVFEVKIQEGKDEFWENIIASGSTGCDELLDMIKAALRDYGFTESYDDITIKLTKFNR